MMFALGLVLGVVLGVVLVTLAYAPLGDRILVLEQLALKEKKLRDDFIRVLQRYEAENIQLKAELAISDQPRNGRQWSQN